MAASYNPREVTGGVSCGDFGLFQDILKRLRTIDDRVINALNTSLPTESFKGKVSAEHQCKGFYEELHLAHTQREAIIKKCINEVSTVVSDLRHKRDSNADDIELIKQLRKEQKTMKCCQVEQPDTDNSQNYVITFRDKGPETYIAERREQRRWTPVLRQMQQELNIEEVVRDSSLKVFYERCRLLYVPPSLRPS